MLFAIIALIVSAAQILMGIAIGLMLRKYRERRALDGETCRVSVTVPESSVDEQLEARHQQRCSGVSSRRSGDAQSEATQPEIVHREARSGNACAVTDNTLRAAGSDGAISGSDRRTSLRRSFEFRQNVAPYFGGALPGRASFREVECHDISSTGFSFLSSQLPDFEAIVVALGVAPRLIYLQAEIINRFQIDDGPAPLYRIGCRFTGQLN